MTNREFLHLLDMAISKGNLSNVPGGLDNVYVLLTWWDDIFLPLIFLDGSWRSGEKICVFGCKEDACNKWHDGLPCAFWINKEAVRIAQVVHRPISLKMLYEMQGENPDAPRKFLICDSPKNLFVDINPHKTRIIRNWEGETMLCFYAENRDSGEMVSFDRMKEDDIIVIDRNKKPGKYKYGVYIPRGGSPTFEVNGGGEKAIEKPMPPRRAEARVWCLKYPTRKCVDCELCPDV